jgi:hypothetical protein
MALLNEPELRSFARARSSRMHESVTESLRKSILASKQQSSFDIFLCHSYLDHELIGAITGYLEELGYVVYVDWRQDAQLNRQNVTKDTAKVLRERMAQSKALFFAITARAHESRWMPWELGYMDGRSGTSAILPIAEAAFRSDAYEGQEYLGIYPYITSGPDTKGRERLWVRDDEETYVTFDAWLKGKQPWKRS